MKNVKIKDTFLSLFMKCFTGWLNFHDTFVFLITMLVEFLHVNSHQFPLDGH